MLQAQTACRGEFPSIVIRDSRVPKCEYDGCPDVHFDSLKCGLPPMSCHDGATLDQSRVAAVVLTLRGARWSLTSISVDRILGPGQILVATDWKYSDPSVTSSEYPPPCESKTSPAQLSTRCSGRLWQDEAGFHTWLDDIVPKGGSRYSRTGKYWMLDQGSPR